MHYCSTEYGSSGSPILNLSNNKIIGIHKGREGKKEYNRGSLLSYTIKEFIQKYNKKDIVKQINMKKLEINDKDFFNNLYNKGLIKDFIQIKDKGLDVAYRFLLNQKNYQKNYYNWKSAWHGTIIQNLDSIIKYGLQIQGTQLENGRFTPKTKYKHPEFAHGIKNWENAIFASDKLFLAKDYSVNKFRCILEVKMKPDNYTLHDPYEGRHFACVCYEEGFFIEDETIYRISSSENIIVNSIILIDDKFIEDILNLYVLDKYNKYINLEKMLTA